RFNITPPDDIMEECIEKGFVKKDYKLQYYHIQRAADAEMLKLVAGEYNKRLQFHNSSAAPIKLNDITGSFARIEEEKKELARREVASMDKYAMDGAFMAPANNLSEVVVTGYSTARTKRAFYSSTTVASHQLMGSVTLGQALQGRVAGVQIINSPGTNDIAQVRIRGVSSLSGNGNPLYVVDGVPLPFDQINQLSPSEVFNITVIRSAEGSAIYGVRGANGVIVVQTKRGMNYNYTNPNSITRLKDAEDEEYIMDIQLTSTELKYRRYLELKEEHKTNMAFFLDMAMHFSEMGLSQHIEEMMLEAAEISNNDYNSLQAIAFVYEYIRNFKKAAEIYGELGQSYPGNLKLLQQQAWAVYQGGQPDSAVQMLYRAITREDFSWNTYNLQTKEAMLADMNMIIAVHPGEVNTKYIPAEIIRPVTASMRVQLQSNMSLMHTLTVKAGDKPIAPGASHKQYKLDLSYYGYDEASLTALEKENGRIRISLKHYDTWYANQVPPMVKIVTIRDFGKPGQRIHTELVSLKNQYGTVEIADIKQ
ncbi:MAG: TonB-dependent receptor plug domain-containing protein, partial [Dinghuibacter sp.]|nr:TonB-dependent receptor plug domain-containing protein [Dinghuibacter sp.]